jgi:hypothetical protein
MEDNDMKKEVKSEFVFHNGPPENTWIIKISREGISFNHEAFPNCTSDDFAKAFVEILEKNYTVSFTEKEK